MLFGKPVKALGIHHEDDERMAICLLDWVQSYEATAPDRQVADRGVEQAAELAR